MEKISVVILSGGRSSRMGKDKATLTLDGKTFVDCLKNNLSMNFSDSDVMDLYCDEILLSVRNPEDFPDIELSHIADEYPGCGPLAGIQSALKHAVHDWIFVVACDSPFVTVQTVKELYKHVSKDIDAVVPMEADGRVHVLCGLYHKRILKTLDQALQMKNYRVYAVLSELNTTYVPVSEFTDHVHVFQNVNTPEAYQEVCR